MCTTEAGRSAPFTRTVTASPGESVAARSGEFRIGPQRRQFCLERGAFGSKRGGIEQGEHFARRDAVAFIDQNAGDPAAQFETQICRRGGLDLTGERAGRGIARFDFDLHDTDRHERRDDVRAPSGAREMASTPRTTAPAAPPITASVTVIVPIRRSCRRARLLGLSVTLLAEVSVTAPISKAS
jgi:hypothetical protein